MATKPGKPFAPLKGKHPARATYDRRTKQRQNRFLVERAKCGVTSEAAKKAGIGVHVVQDWAREDTLGFASRYDEAREVFGDYLKALAYKRLANPEKGVGGDILMISAISANGSPEWRQQTVILNDDTPIKVLAMLKEMASNSPRVVQGRSKPALPDGNGNESQ